MAVTLQQVKRAEKTWAKLEAGAAALESVGNPGLAAQVQRAADAYWPEFKSLEKAYEERR